MIVTILGSGTSQGVPVIGCNCAVCKSLDFRDKRLRASIHIAIDNRSFIIDSGPDFRQQVLREGISSLDALLFTHEHKDHTAGMDDIRSFNFLQERDMPVYARKQVLGQLKQEYAYVFAASKYPGVPRVEVHEIKNEDFIVEGIKVTPIEVLHYKLPVFGYRIGDFAYITDMKSISDEEFKKLNGVKALVVNALQQTPHISHLTLEEAIDFAQKVGAEQTYLTHLSHKMGKQRDVEKMLPENIAIAFDGLKIAL
ncbi:MBL fold metallo-hydrolase [Roseivirga pacifica]|uniref:MBL fold metallo-hydrolase n=1 Tax=Roseivirga pacifica TaxID=1267423 RepID=UPI002095EA58|nr:MBL fold metallo-hydrolase [Roseivirga pacifica]MCO6357998.1 MBL fold metallo-hydrolase [Roseivirga pacifica]MCO6366437.1 MBL fold metallo-hydrolase [Roseivirga pacifica]MCO6370922.1 MBL fold metallo-hydrolase [Roseivirga pacifica]MCO6373730.1 MBL fold metallo-hydrolase [Roseivirga pacifica]MCO6380711.1 MBL fold metallo-hydrolase [Roseivirga pacifica]